MRECVCVYNYGENEDATIKIINNISPVQFSVLLGFSKTHTILCTRTRMAAVWFTIATLTMILCYVCACPLRVCTMHTYLYVRKSMCVRQKCSMAWSGRSFSFSAYFFAILI